MNLIGGTAILTREALTDAGGFVDLSAWPTSYSDHLHLSADLAAAGYHLYHCPDPRLSAVHLKFGAVGRYPLDATQISPRSYPVSTAASWRSWLSCPRSPHGHRLPRRR